MCSDTIATFMQAEVVLVCSQPAVANKRKILKPVNVNYSTSGKHQDVLPANMLFGDAFMVPKLRR